MAKDRGSSPLFILVAMVTAVAALYFAKEILLPIALAALLSFLLSPLVDKLEGWRCPRAFAVILVVLMSVAVIGGLGWIVTNQLVDLTRHLSVHEHNLIAKVQSLRPKSATLDKVSQTLTDLRNELLNGGEAAKNTKQNVTAKPSTTTHSRQPNEKPETGPSSAENTASGKPFATDIQPPNEIEAIPVKVVELPSSPLGVIENWLGPLVGPLTAAGLVVVLVLFMLLDREGQRNRLIQLFGRSHLHSTTEAVHDVARRIGRYLRALFVVNACYGVVIALGLWFIGIPGAMTWGVLSFAFRFVPYLGPWIAASMPFLIAIATSTGWLQPLLVFGWYVVVELITYNAIEPFVYGSSVGISTVGVLVAAIFWTWLWGIIGLILAMPMTVCLVVAARYVPQLRFITILLADETPLTVPERVYQRLLAFDYREALKLTHQQLKDSSLTNYYDDVLVPALRMAEHDRHNDLLNEEQATFVMEAAEDLVQDLGDEAYAAVTAESNGKEATPPIVDRDASGKRTPTARVHCIPLRDQADEATSHMLAQLLVAEGFDVVTERVKSLTSEVVDRVSDSKSDIVVISILPPIRSRESRLLWKRLRSRYPDLPIVVGFWAGATHKEGIPAPESNHLSKTATTLAEATALVRSLAAERQLSAKTA
ncbi:MAG TPA: AI-2E family transporter [Lacipirellulaceae bacterium]|nr:AI-2E family transporter [Lacipirellulaceae bacterium]